MSKAKWELWTAIVGLILGVVGLLTAVVQYQEKRLANDAKVKTEIERDAARSDATEERIRRENLEKRQDSIRQFMINYRAHLRVIRDALSRLAEAQKFGTTPDAVPKAEQDLVVHVLAYAKFIQEWKDVHRELELLLDGEVTRMLNAARTPSGKPDTAEIELHRRILEQNLSDKEPLLQEKARLLDQLGK